MPYFFIAGAIKEATSQGRDGHKYESVKNGTEKSRCDRVTSASSAINRAKACARTRACGGAPVILIPRERPFRDADRDVHGLICSVTVRNRCHPSLSHFAPPRSRSRRDETPSVHTPATAGVKTSGVRRGRRGRSLRAPVTRP